MVGVDIILLFAGAVGLATASPVGLGPRQSGASTTSPPWYPSPKGGSSASWAGSYAKARDLVSKMTLVEKVNITTGIGFAMGPCVGNTGPVPRLGFPSLCLQDGPLGVRFTDKITSFPAGVTIGGTWDKELLKARGVAMGSEFRGKGVNVALGPVMGALGRLPAAGRNWEGFGSDPYLQGIGSAETIKGIQSAGVVATAKHFIANEQEHFRQGINALSSNIDDRTLHEMYLWPFQDSVKAGVGAVMCSYNKVNNSAACQNSWLQNGILKDELGFQGFIMSDWLAQMSGVASALAGLDMSMPGDGLVWDDRVPFFGPNLTLAVMNSSVPLERIDDMVTRIVATWYQFGQDKDYPEPNFNSWTKNDTGLVYFGSNKPPYAVVNKHVDVQADHAKLARKIAADAIALLKNEGNALPMGQPMKIGVYGSDAGPGDGPNACVDRGCNQGTLAVGWGSGTTEFEYLVSPLEAIQKYATTYGGVVSSILVNNQTAKMKVDAAKQDICLVFVNANSGEGYITWGGMAGDRLNLETQLGGDAVVLAVAEACKKTVVVVHSVGPINMEKWARSDKVDAILWAHLPGQESGNALVDVLSGAVNPSGKLPYTIARKFEDYGPTAGVLYVGGGNPPQQDFSEGLYIDYRYFDKNNISPRYAFGFGLSYTTFKFSGLDLARVGSTSPNPAPRPTPEAAPPTYHSTLPPPSEVLYPAGFKPINRMIYPYLTSANITRGVYPYPDGYNKTQAPSPAGGAEGGNPSLWEPVYNVSHTLTNTGNVSGAEVSQLYVSYAKDSVDFPVRVLRGFEKRFLAPGKGCTVTHTLTRRDLSFWNTLTGNWEIPDGGIEIAVGSSSRKLHLQGKLDYGN